jgi:cytochrome P450
MSNAPRFDIDLAEFWRDPYPALARIRAEAPIAFVPQLGGTVLSRYDDIMASEKLIDVFSSHQPNGLMNRLMGHNLMRKDGAAHTAERKTVFPAMSPRTVKDHWLARFQSHSDRLLDELAPAGEADLFHAYAMPFSAECLKDVTGLTNAHWKDMDTWSQGMIDGIANYAGDPAVEARCHAATAAIDTAIDDMLPAAKANPGRDMLSLMLQGGMPMDSIRANIKLAISGGQNEPRDTVAGAIWALLEHPDQLAAVLRGEVTWHKVFEEFVRWISPIGMMPRRVARQHTIAGVTFEPEDRVFFFASSANRDEAHFPGGDRFDVGRIASPNIAFGAGPHYCVGAWVSSAMVAGVALPSIFRRLQRLRLGSERVRTGGWAFRGILNLPARWDSTEGAGRPLTEPAHPPTVRSRS